ncbi:MAG: protein aq [Chlamydiales bacterium]|jgi:pyridoxal phosphate enzyme (YggS family)|nr:protein aq [Chlamydiales bacterium]
MTEIQDRFLALQQKIAESAKRASRSADAVQLLPVSKFHPLESLLEVHALGNRAFAESRVQEALSKIEKAPSSLEWHFIGTLQSNKISKVVPHFHLIHSVDSLSLAQKIGAFAQKEGKTQPILLQVNITLEESKHGFTAASLKAEWESLCLIPGISVEGLMTMGPLPSVENWLSKSRQTFSSLRELKDDLQQRGGYPLPHLSMGMSDDFEVAIEEGATLIRIGSKIFGPRIYL